ncbi:MAG: hypothetical protein ACYTFI_23970 [Planctomycetota bacterium]|jgi:hypothetical protein
MIEVHDVRRSRAWPPAACCAFALLLLAGCESIRHDFMPLAAGNSWTYRVTSAGRTLGTESMRVTEKIERRGGVEFGKGTEMFRVKEPGGLAVWMKDTGSVVRSGGRGSSVILQHPPFVGTGWWDNSPGGGRVECKVVAREAVRTPAGWFFDCVVIRRETEDRSLVVKQWFAPGVGLVKRRIERPRRAAIVSALERYELAE